MSQNKEVLAIKLKTGDEIIGEYEFKDPYVIIKNPVGIISAQSGEGRMSFMPWFAMCKNRSFQFDQNEVFASGEPLEELLEQYNSMFGKIHAPQQNIITQ